MLSLQSIESLAVDNSLLLSNKQDALNAIDLLRKQKRLDIAKIENFYQKQIDTIQSQMKNLPN